MKTKRVASTTLRVPRVLPREVRVAPPIPWAEVLPVVPAPALRVRSTREHRRVERQAVPQREAASPLPVPARQVKAATLGLRRVAAIRPLPVLREQVLLQLPVVRQPPELRRLPGLPR